MSSGDKQLSARDNTSRDDCQCGKRCSFKESATAADTGCFSFAAYDESGCSGDADHLARTTGELCKARIDSGFGSTYLLSRPTYGPHLCIASRAAGWAGRELVHRQYSRTRLQLRRLSQGVSTRELNEKRPSRPNVCKKYHTAGSCCPRSTTAAQRPVRSPSGLAVRLDRSLPSAVRCSCCSRAAGGRHGHRPSGT
jgi:hypothetical protein